MLTMLTQNDNRFSIVNETAGFGEIVSKTKRRSTLESDHDHLVCRFQRAEADQALSEELIRVNELI